MTLATTMAAPAAPSSTVLPLFTRRRLGGLLAIVVVALVFRIQGLSVRGFSEDEMAKLNAVQAYRHAEFSANAEHPMLMKLAIWSSLAIAQRWNVRAPASLTVAPETALRLPNAIAGAATPVAVYGAAALLLDPFTGLIAALLVGTDPTIISVNRLGKEDTFMVFFFMLAVFCYERAKRLWATDPQMADRCYTMAGTCFGLMLASKYMPHLLGVYALFNLAVVRNAGGNVPRARPYYGAMLVAFLVANFAIVLPDSWAYAGRYMGGERQVHHGYMYNGQLYVNTASVLLWGVPWTYYLRMIATKMPLTVVAAAIAAMPLLVTRRREPGFAWLRVFLVIQLLGYAVFAAKFQRYALPLLVVVDILAAVGVVMVLRWILAREGVSTSRRVATCAAVMAVVIIVIVRAPLTVAPHFSIYQNVLGARLATASAVYPEEAYDYGVREAVAAVCEAAGSGAVIVSDANMVVDYYLQRANRRDIVSRSLSGDGLLPHGDQWVLVQDNHLSFENAGVVAQLRAQRQPWREYRLHGRLALQVFRVTR
jgi:4-amino-4-deoxy-L-arabinose transferase-like glycosyltransferase